MHIKKKKWPQKTNYRYPYDVDITERFQISRRNSRTGDIEKRFDYNSYDCAGVEDWCYHNLKGDFSGGPIRWWFEKRNDALLFKLKWN